MIAAPLHEVKSAAAVIADDVICQSFIQSSSTLAYACLLIRRGSYELAGHVLHSLEAKQASRFKDMVFYLQAQIGIETGEYAMVKKRLVPRVHRHPNDMVALSLLEECVYREFAASPEASAERPAVPPAAPAFPTAPAGSPFGNAEAASAAAMASVLEATAAPQPPEARPSVPVAAASPSPVPPPSAAAPAVDIYPTRRDGVPTVRPAAAAPRPSPSGLPPAEAPSPAAAPRPAPLPGREASTGHRAASSGEAELGLYQGIAQDPNTHALAVWNGQGRMRSYCRMPDLEPLVQALPRELPAALQGACSALESGPLHKICLSFQHLTATTFHAGAEGMALITGPLNQSLLAIVRAENTFKKAALGGPAAPSGHAASPGASA